MILKSQQYNKEYFVKFLLCSPCPVPTHSRWGANVGPTVPTRTVAQPLLLPPFPCLQKPPSASPGLDTGQAPRTPVHREPSHPGAGSGRPLG